MFSICFKNIITKLIKAVGVFAVPAFFACLFSMVAFAAQGNSALPNGGMGVFLTGGSELSDITTGNNKEIEKRIDCQEYLYELIGPQEEAAVSFSTDTLSYAEYLEYMSCIGEDICDDNMVITNINNYICLWSEPSDKSESLGKMYSNCVGYIQEDLGDWYLLSSGDVTGYVMSKYFITGDEARALADEVGMCFAVVDSQALYVRSENNEEANVTAIIKNGDEMLVTSVDEGWIGVETVDGEGWISAEYASLCWEFRTAESAEAEAVRIAKEAEARRIAEERARAALDTIAKMQQQEDDIATGQAGNGNEMPEFDNGNDTSSTTDAYQLGVQLVEYALQFVGNPYVYGGTSLTNGTDCSGFTQSLYAYYGVNISRGSESQRSDGYSIGSIEDAWPGDIICYSGHVAIYIGDGKIVHAANPARGIVTDNYTIMTVLDIRRIFN